MQTQLRLWPGGTGEHSLRFLVHSLQNVISEVLGPLLVRDLKLLLLSPWGWVIKNGRHLLSKVAHDLQILFALVSMT